MKKVLIFVLFLIIIIPITYYFINNTHKLNKKIEIDKIFKKKQECIKLEGNMRKQLEGLERYSNRSKGTTLYLSKVFYSPIRNSCLYMSEFIYGDMYKLEINDYFTKEIIFERLCNFGDDNTSSGLECSGSFNKKIEELRK